jgi:hypothetical protein
LDFWFENKPSGNPERQMLRSVAMKPSVVHFRTIHAKKIVVPVRSMQKNCCASQINGKKIVVPVRSMAKYFPALNVGISWFNFVCLG